MKRRLTRAYDSMTMPESCTQRIEQILSQSMEAKKTGGYVKPVQPKQQHRNPWTVAVAAVCLMLVLSVGGTVLFFRISETMMQQPSQIISEIAASEADGVRTAEDHYSAATNLSVEAVEAFAEIIRHNVLSENWEALKNRFHFPLTVQERKIQDWQAFLEWMNTVPVYSSCWQQLEQETCRAMFCNWQGICMAEGFIWFNEVDGELKVTAMNMEKKEEPAGKKQVPEIFASVLSGDRIMIAGVLKEQALDEYCADTMDDVGLDAFAVADLDADGICEIVVSKQTAEGKEAGYLVLRQEGEKIRGYSFLPGELMDLKKDGTFFRRDRNCRLAFEGEGSCRLVEAEDQDEKPAAQWFAYPCVRPDLLLRSYGYVTGTGWTLMPGAAYYEFARLILEQRANDWEHRDPYFQKTMEIDDDMVYIFDPDAPGTVFYGTLTEENGFSQFSSAGCYICARDREYQAEVRNLLSEEPEYWADIHQPILGTMGRRVSTAEELMAYFGFDPMPDEAVMRERNAIKTLTDAFTEAYLTGDTGVLEGYLTEGFRSRVEGLPNRDKLEVGTLAYGILPDRVMAVGETCTLSADLRLAGENGSYWFNLELLKQEDGWKVQSYRLQEYE